MITRFDKLAMDLPHPNNPSPNSAAAVQELLGGKFGEMSTFMNYTFQSFNFRGRSKMRPFYDLVATIATEEFSKSRSSRLDQSGSMDDGARDDPRGTPRMREDARKYPSSRASGAPMDSQGNSDGLEASRAQPELDL